MKNFLYPRIFCLCWISSSLFSLPTGANTISGDVALLINEQSMEVSASDGAIIEWKDFSIGKAEKTVFLQPSKEALVLNRVIEPNPSQILGKLEAVGRVVLVNPYGVFIGQDAQINTGSLIASTLDLQNENFKNHKMLFEGESEGTISSSGNITTLGDVFILADTINVTELYNRDVKLDLYLEIR